MTLRERKTSGSGFTLGERVAIWAILVLVAAFLIIGIFPRHTHHGQVNGAWCANNLKNIYTLAFRSSDESGTGRFPLAPGKSPRAHESLNELLKLVVDGLSPSIFVCPLSDSTKATRDADGRFILSESTSSYTWTAEPLETRGPPRPLASDRYIDGFEDAGGRHAGHRGGMHVLYTDGSVQFVPEKDLEPRTGLPPGLTR